MRTQLSVLVLPLAVLQHPWARVEATSRSMDRASEKALAQCMQRRVRARRGHAGPVAMALGFNFTGGESRARGGYWYEKEDEYVFTHFFSDGGRPPFKAGGTFLECGAHDGVSGSNTLWFERALQWSGVLVEGTPLVYKELVRSRGNTSNTLVNAVVCEEGRRVTYHVPVAERKSSGHGDKIGDTTAARPGFGDTVQSGVVAGISASLPARNKVWLPSSLQVACKPLGAILREAAVSRVDFFSLDVEGAELTVLQTLDPTAAPSMFGLIMIEQDGRNPTKDSAVRSLMGSWGFQLRGRTGQWCSSELYQKA